MNIAITGHRPERIKNQEILCKHLSIAFEDNNAFRVIQGMAPGVDLLAAKVAYLAGIPFVCAIPYPTHRGYVIKNYPDWLTLYDRVLTLADEAVFVSDQGSQWAFQKRNEWMVDRADIVAAGWDGAKKGGTWNCVKYANQKNVPVQVIPVG